MSKKIRRKGSGRTKGSYSFVKLSLSDLLSKIGSDQTTPVIVSRKWAEVLGFKGLVCGPAGAINDSIEGQTPATKITAKVSNFDND
jgi:hypothetical protein